MKAMSIAKFNETRRNTENAAYLDIEQSKVIESITLNGNSATVVFYGYAHNWNAKQQLSVVSIDTTIHVL